MQRNIPIFPCPCCGNINIEISWAEDETEGVFTEHTVFCPICGYQISGKSKHTLIQEWNNTNFGSEE